MFLTIPRPAIVEVIIIQVWQYTKRNIFSKCLQIGANIISFLEIISIQFWFHMGVIMMLLCTENYLLQMKIIWHKLNWTTSIVWYWQIFFCDATYNHYFRHPVIFQPWCRPERLSSPGNQVSHHCEWGSEWRQPCLCDQWQQCCSSDQFPALSSHTHTHTLSAMNTAHWETKPQWEDDSNLELNLFLKHKVT